MTRKEDALLTLESLAALVHPGYPGRVVVLGIGNRLREDDGVGPEVAGQLNERWQKQVGQFPVEGERIFVDAGESPEDWFVRILDLKPKVIIAVDAVDLQAEPGSIAVLSVQDLPKSLLCSTHRLPLKSLLTLWEQSGSKTVVVAIQPERVGFVQGFSRRVKRSIDCLVELLSGEDAVVPRTAEASPE
ncbi:MAG: hydrogenase maturation protease [Deltaproteobacteria bacterium]|nr:hydrogenase maturation protease [Deltaproteobacteria bacterium]